MAAKRNMYWTIFLLVVVAVVCFGLYSRYAAPSAVNHRLDYLQDKTITLNLRMNEEVQKTDTLTPVQRLDIDPTEILKFNSQAESIVHDIKATPSSKKTDAERLDTEKLADLVTTKSRLLEGVILRRDTTSAKQLVVVNRQIQALIKTIQ